MYTPVFLENSLCFSFDTNPLNLNSNLWTLDLYFLNETKIIKKRTKTQKRSTKAKAKKKKKKKKKKIKQTQPTAYTKLITPN